MQLDIQYLEPSPDVAGYTEDEVRERLRQAADLLPLRRILLGWNLPARLVDAVKEESARLGLELYRWQPLLCSDGQGAVLPEWQVTGLGGQVVAGFNEMPEFTFACPNHPEGRAALLARLEQVACEGGYAGVFLDRIRYPSPSAGLEAALGCFCPHCQELAAQQGLDLLAAQHEMARLAASALSAWDLVETLIDPNQVELVPLPVSKFLHFRMDSITRLVKDATGVIRAAGLGVGLDCFSPVLAAMVGQDLRALPRLADWVKLMSYTRAFGPAGLPYELNGLAGMLLEREQERRGLGEKQVFGLLAGITDLPLPRSREALRRDGLPPETLRREVRRARAVGVDPVLVGVEWVRIPEVAEIDPLHLRACFQALRDEGVDGVVASWDLWHAPLENLQAVGELLAAE